MNRVYFYSPRGGWPTNVMVPSERVKEVADKLLGRTKDNPFRSISIDPEFRKTWEIPWEMLRIPVESRFSEAFSEALSLPPGTKLQLDSARDRAVKALRSIRGE